MALSSDYIRTSLQSLYGNTVTSADIRAWCSMNDANYQTVTKKIDEFKTGWHDNDKLLYVIKNNEIIYSEKKI